MTRIDSSVALVAMAVVVFINSSAKAQFVGLENFEGLDVGDNPTLLPNVSNPFGDLAVVESAELGSKVVVGTGEGTGLARFNRMQIDMISPVGHAFHRITADLYLFAGDSNQHIHVFFGPYRRIKPHRFLGTLRWHWHVEIRRSPFLMTV